MDGKMRLKGKQKKVHVGHLDGKLLKGFKQENGNTDYSLEKQPRKRVKLLIRRHTPQTIGPMDGSKRCVRGRMARGGTTGGMWDRVCKLIFKKPPRFPCQTIGTIHFGRDSGTQRRMNGLQERKMKRSQQRGICILFQFSACLGGGVMKSFIPTNLP